MNKKYYILIFAFCSIWANPEFAFGETKEAYSSQRNELRIGWADQLFESLMWHNPTHITTTLPPAYRFSYRENFRHSQHWWVEYQWRFKSWFGLGAMMDASGVSWDNVTRDGAGTELKRETGQHFYNIVIMPTIRFTYYHHENVNLYSGLGVGMDINGGTETNAQGQHTVVCPAAHITVFGVSANYKRWFGAVEWGGMYALQNFNTVFMLSSRIMNVSVGARF